MIIFLEENRGIAFLVIAVFVTAVVTAAFMYFGRPNAVIIARGGEERLELVHRSGEPVTWDGLSLSVTEGRNSEVIFRDPATHPFGENNQLLPNRYPVIREGVEIYINRTSTGEMLVTENVYHVVLRHDPSGIRLVNMNARVRESY